MARRLQTRMVRLARSMIGDKKANFAVMAALSAPVALALAAFAIDEASIYNERRTAQAMTDLAAITGASNITDIQNAVVTTLKDNGMPGIIVQQPGQTVTPTAGQTVVAITPGQYTAASTTAVGQRFQAGVTPYNAVNVVLHKIPARYFASALIPPPVIGTQATASMTPMATFAVGSRLLSLNGGILNSLLSGLLGGNISLSVMDYNALVSADVDVLSFTSALATQLNLTAGTYSDVLASKATIGQIAAAMASVPGLDGTSAAALQAIAGKATSTVKIPLNTLVDLGGVGNLAIGQKPPGLGVSASAIGMLTAGAVLANGTNQVALNLGATIPGLTSTTVTIAIGEPMQFSPWLSINQVGTTVRTAQTRIKISSSVTIGTSALGGGVNLLAVNLPLNVEVAYAQATLTNITCPNGPSSIKVSIAAQPGIAALHLANTTGTGFANFSQPQSFTNAEIADVNLSLLLVNIPLLQVMGSAATAITNNGPQTLTFNATDIANKATKTVSTRNITQSLTSSLINNLSMSINALGLGLDVTGLLNTITPAVTTVLNGVTAPVDNLLYNLLSTLGVSVGSADVRVTGATCGRAVLVQ
ncbi:TadG family pilus assembly protein [Mesorhizobium sp.]|uniref:TadG family pilus assembly protein n=2 Tax=Pseudomonadota TaxID=1224 RepID=UPI0025FAB9D3|nr:TadG family pilus assembly protein [Mesorhizobium sp.]